MSVQPHAGVYALLADGATIEIRSATAGDFGAVLAMHRAMSPDNIYLRFFCMSPAAAEREAGRICREPADDHAALLTWLAGELVGSPATRPGGSAAPRRLPSPCPTMPITGEWQRCCSSTWCRLPVTGG
jgi:hypothetical protein